MNVRKVVFVLVLILIPAVCILAEGPGGPGSGSNGNGSPTGNGGIPVGGNAPLGSGITIMMISACVYGVKKVYRIRKR